MKVVQLVGWYYPEGRGGTEAYVAAVAHALQRAGHDVRVAAPLAGWQGVREDTHDGIPVFRYGIPSAPTRREISGDAEVRGADALHRWLARERPDVVHAHAFVTGLGLPELAAARAAGARVFVTTHAARLGWLCQRGTMLFEGRTPCDGLAHPAKCAACLAAGDGPWRGVGRAVAHLPVAASAAARALLPGRLGGLAGRPAHIAANLTRQHTLFRDIEAFFVLTQWAAQVVVANGAPADRVVLSRLGCVPPSGGRKPGPEAHPTTAPVHVGMVTRFDHVKGLDVLAHALRLAPQAAVRVTVRGPVDTPEEHRIRDAFVAATAGDARVTVAGPVTRDALGDVLRAFDVLCCPSRTAEGGPTIALEALAVGTPVIGSALGALAELIDDHRTGRVFPAEDARALADVLTTLGAQPTVVDAWRRVLPPARTMDDVCRELLAWYARGT